MSRSCVLTQWTRTTALAAIVVLLASSAAEALTFRLCECSTSTPYLAPGTTLTLGFRIEGDTDEGLYGLGASIFGYEESVIDFQSGEAVTSIFHGVAIPAIGAFEGLDNQVGGRPLQESSIGSNGNRVLIFNGVGLRPRSYNPLDPGLDGIIGGGGAQIRVTLVMTGFGVTSLLIGTGYEGDGAVYPGGSLDQSIILQLPIGGMDGPSSCPVPEPGTALLIGLGLASLGWRGRKSKPDVPRRLDS